MKVHAMLLAGIVCLAQEPPRQGGWIVLPVGEYQALRAKAYPEAEPPAAEAAFTRIEYELTIDGADALTEGKSAADRADGASGAG